ncbi:hypothetical protein ACGFS9_24890 [Streptomyces sp. NPDC048566]|uniref:hypothetical protein n=1 Tax=Streptomyces sp. NPDC048566 TaxID=3365569 RepID=UPI0037239A5C
MFEYEMHQIRTADLIREARDHRLAQEVLRGRRAARRAARAASARQDPEGGAQGAGPRRRPSTRAA